MLRCLMLLLVVGCTGPDLPPLPIVRVTVPDGAAVLPDYERGAAAWGAIGFDVRAGSEPLAPECDRLWYRDPREVDCEITIGIVAEPGLREAEGTDALSIRDLRTVRIDTRLTGFALCVAIAHEVGHIVLDTSEHTAGGVMGGADCVLADVDRDLACRAIGVCL